MDTPQERCRCNRPTERVHCPKCGSLWIAAVRRNGRTKILSNGTEKFIRGFRCRSCDQDFQEDWPCAAPFKVYGAKPRHMSEADKAVSKQPRAQREQRIRAAGLALEKILQRRGLSLPPSQSLQSSNDSTAEGEGGITDTSNDAMFGGKDKE